MRWVALVLVAVAVSGCLDPQPVRSVDARDPWAGSYHALLHWPEPYPEVLWVIHAAPGQEPTPDILPDLRREMALALDKPVTLVVEPLEVPAGKDVWTLPDLYGVAARLHEEDVRDGRIVLHSAALPGCVHYDEDRGCIDGVEVDDVGFVFLDGFRQGSVVDDLPDPFGLGSAAGERYILMHETGHAVGLVTVPLPTRHPERIQDEPCKCHSRNSESVMSGSGLALGTLEHGHYVGLAGRILEGRAMNYRFDSNDLDDLRDFQEHGRRLQARGRAGA